MGWWEGEARWMNQPVESSNGCGDKSVTAGWYKIYRVKKNWKVRFFRSLSKAYCVRLNVSRRLRGRKTVCQQVGGKLPRRWSWRWRPSRVLGAGVRGGRELRKVGPGCSGVLRLCGLAVRVW